MNSWAKGEKPVVSSNLFLSLLLLILSQCMHLQNGLDEYSASKLLPELVLQNKKVVLLTWKDYNEPLTK